MPDPSIKPKNGEKWRFLTLTGHTLTSEGIEDHEKEIVLLRKSWKKLVRKYRMLGYFSVVERVFRGESVFYHVHAVALCGWIDQKALSFAWDCLVGRPVVDIRSVDGHGGAWQALRYVRKYLGKGIVAMSKTCFGRVRAASEAAYIGQRRVDEKGFVRVSIHDCWHNCPGCGQSKPRSIMIGSPLSVCSCWDTLDKAQLLIDYQSVFINEDFEHIKTSLAAMLGMSYHVDSRVRKVDGGSHENVEVGQASSCVGGSNQVAGRERTA